MRKKMSRFAVVLAGAASTSTMACSLVPVDPLLLKQIMAKEIAYRLGVKVEQINLDDITAPELHTPFELGADCSGLWAYHHISGFRLELESPQYAVKRIDAKGAGKNYRNRLSRGFYGRWPGAGVRPDYWNAQKTPKSEWPVNSGVAEYLADVQLYGTRWANVINKSTGEPRYPTQADFSKAYKSSADAELQDTRWANVINKETGQPRYPTQQDLSKEYNSLTAVDLPGARWSRTINPMTGQLQYPTQDDFNQAYNDLVENARTYNAQANAQAYNGWVYNTPPPAPVVIPTGVQPYAPVLAPNYWPNYGQYPVIYRLPPPSLVSSPAQKEKCTYEGVAAILGYGASSPVAVNFMRQCN